MPTGGQTPGAAKLCGRLAWAGGGFGAGRRYVGAHPHHAGAGTHLDPALAVGELHRRVRQGGQTRAQHKSPQGKPCGGKVGPRDACHAKIISRGLFLGCLSGG